MLTQLFPRVDATYRGSPVAFWFLILVACLNTVRSLIHLAVPDGGAHTIAGIDLAMAGGVNIVAIFAQWGASQLLQALMQWLVIWRYRFLVPAMLAWMLLEQLLRIIAGRLKPMQIDAAPPGAYSSYALLALSLIFLVLSLRPPRRG
jgi:hypothetical protein